MSVIIGVMGLFVMSIRVRFRAEPAVGSLMTYVLGASVVMSPKTVKTRLPTLLDALCRFSIKLLFYGMHSQIVVRC